MVVVVDWYRSTAYFKIKYANNHLTYRLRAFQGEDCLQRRKQEGVLRGNFDFALSHLLFWGKLVIKGIPGVGVKPMTACPRSNSKLR